MEKETSSSNHWIFIDLPTMEGVDVIIVMLCEALGWVNLDGYQTQGGVVGNVMRRDSGYIR